MVWSVTPAAYFTCSTRTPAKDFSTLQLSQNIEASPAVYGNMLVVGTYAKKLYGIRIS